MFGFLINITLFMVILALFLMLLFPVLFLVYFMLQLVGLAFGAVRSLCNYVSILYIGRHISEITKVSLYPAYETYKQVAVPTGYSSDGWYIRKYYRYGYISKGKRRKAKVYFESNRARTVIFDEKSPIYREITACGRISA